MKQSVFGEKCLRRVAVYLVKNTTAQSKRVGHSPTLSDTRLIGATRSATCEPLSCLWRGGFLGPITTSHDTY